jgi:hypothetical protein
MATCNWIKFSHNKVCTWKGFKCKLN